MISSNIPLRAACCTRCNARATWKLRCKSTEILVENFPWVSPILIPEKSDKEINEIVDTSLFVRGGFFLPVVFSFKKGAGPGPDGIYGNFLRDLFSQRPEEESLGLVYREYYLYLLWTIFNSYFWECKILARKF